MDASRPAIAVICGPTASGKTGIAVDLSKNFPIEIVSADSRQVIRHLDIGTAKPTAQELRQVPFHLVDIVDPGRRYSAFQFMDDANEAIRGILQRKHIPVVVGGTGLYLRALSEGVVEIESSDMAIREKLEGEMAELGPQAMFERLEKIDPLEAASLHPHHKRRVIRALEIHALTGKCKSELVATGAYRRAEFPFEFFRLMPERAQLYQRINQRVDQMLAAGWLDEIRGLVERGMGDDIRRSQVMGYDELLDYLEGHLPWEEAVSQIKQNTRRYAKRQYTWFRHQAAGEFFDDVNTAGQALRRNLSQWV
ncbi:MAG: tRNA (adenosine(37)-N6)-dimethylallyltransferase MiaA [bacterium]